MGKHTQNKWKKAGNWISQQHSAALSSTQQCSICNQFQGFLTFCGVRGEKGENEAKKKRKSIKNTQNKWKKAWNWISQQHSEAHSAALSSTQQCSICNQFQGFLTFCRVRVEKVRTKPKKSIKSIKQIGETMNSGQNKRKTQTKKREKGWELDFPAALSSTQQCSICNQFQGFLTFCRVRVEKVRTKPKNNAKSIKKIGKTMRKDTHKTNGKRHGIVFLTIFKVFSLFAGSGVKKVRTKPKKKQNPSKIEEKQ